MIFQYLLPMKCYNAFTTETFWGTYGVYIYIYMSYIDYRR